MRLDQEFSQQQAVHAQRVEARKFAERNEALEAGQKLHWPFSKEEDVVKKRHEATKLLRDTLDEHMELRDSMDTSDSLNQQPRPRREVVKPDPQNKETWLKPSEGNIYPKFLTQSCSKPYCRLVPSHSCNETRIRKICQRSKEGARTAETAGSRDSDSPESSGR